MKEDLKTTIQELKNIVRKFRDDRDWEQFHDPKNLAEAISIEAGELQELFLWKDKGKIIRELEKDEEFKENVGEELADVIIFCLHFANVTDLDLSSIIKDKVSKTNDKYPAEKTKGTYTKYNKL